MEIKGKKKYIGAAALLLIAVVVAGIAVLTLKKPAADQPLSKGDIVALGTYEQNNNLSDGAEPIEWRVLERIGDEVLLLSVNCLDCRTYNDVPFEPVTWETSAIRAWLGDEFYNSVFTDEEKQRIVLADNVNTDQSEAGTEGGADTQDYVFLLSEQEAGIYMGNEIDQEYVGKAVPTAYAIEQGAHIDETGAAEWWLRSPGAYEYTAQFVEPSGVPYIAGAYADISYAVRPAIWIKVGAKQ